MHIALHVKIFSSVVDGNDDDYSCGTRWWFAFHLPFASFALLFMTVYVVDLSLCLVRFHVINMQISNNCFGCERRPSKNKIKVLALLLYGAVSSQLHLCWITGQ